MSEDIHGGHRARMKQRYLSQGLDGFSDHEALELLLTYGSPRKDTKQLAKNLLATFGNLKCVFEAKPEQLMQAEGVGEAQATLISMMLPLTRECLKCCNYYRRKSATRSSSRSTLTFP